ncbi:D-alanyl-D-alanine-carboxypeptidase/endopeptidase AmpH [Pseudooceanicola sp. HF7]|uniref:D-alanyl-D-alanine- carboxypeptidase/endopeptidase AmpH n=1 Tax=Pseudooceanicola sp. HF7 TaxID=2721560 RepID=UPI00143057BF|nr:D-alanyl-D-alanine-carboxypeptidase/endopeptidase AmpH [Pseudooceanicola sp. HF7]NIZ08385.1 D-alanyl-D-alanine-carboxypeptidase/endopeptidase AmpH [Pseudooceanicola sp. HF7]
MNKITRFSSHIFIAAAASTLLSQPARAADPLLEDAVDFSGQIFYLSAGVPGIVIGAIRNGETHVAGFGETASGGTPDGDTIFRIGSITKAFAGEMLAHAVAGKEVGLTDPLADHLEGSLQEAAAQHPDIRLVELATHSAGLPREAIEDWGPAEDPFSTVTLAAFETYLENQPLLFAPGSAITYSNVGFDLLAQALSNSGGASYAELIQDRILGPLDMGSTGFAPVQRDNMFIGHAPDGSAMDVVPTGDVILGSGGLYSSANDLLKWLSWHLDDQQSSEVRFIDHGVYVQREGKHTVLSMDESGHMDAMSLGWVAMYPNADHPFVLQKSGALQGQMSYVAFAPERGTGVVITMNQYAFESAYLMADVANGLLADISGF